MKKTITELRLETALALEESHRIALEWLHTDLQTSLLFARQALDPTNSAEKRTRNRHNGRRGYDAVKHFRERLDLPSAQLRRLDVQLRELKSALENAGEEFLDR